MSRLLVIRVEFRDRCGTLRVRDFLAYSCPGMLSMILHVTGSLAIRIKPTSQRQSNHPSQKGQLKPDHPLIACSSEGC